jgi:uncharacterized protein
MGKIVVWIVVVFAVLFALRLYNGAKGRARAAARARKPAEVEAMVRCARCGVFLPRPDAAVAADGFRCREPACQGSRPPPR